MSVVTVDVECAEMPVVDPERGGQELRTATPRSCALNTGQRDSESVAVARTTVRVRAAARHGPSHAGVLNEIDIEDRAAPHRRFRSTGRHRPPLPSSEWKVTSEQKAHAISVS